MLAIAAALCLAACTPPVEDPRGGGALITVFHAEAETPAPAGGLFERYGLTGAGVGFNAAELARLPAGEITTGYPRGAAAQDWRGPRVSALLAAVDAPGAGARLTALDGYQVTVTAQEIAAHEPILTLARDGEALSLGGLGPAIMIWPRDTDPDLAEMNDERWPWGVIAVEVVTDG
jgi:hypothetical protein